MKRFVLIATAAALLFSTCISGVYAGGSGIAVQKKVMFYLKPDIAIEMNGVRQVFKDVNGHMVFPIVYNGTAYLPVRAVSSLMKEPIEWDSGSKTVYIGKTLMYPVKSEARISNDYAHEADKGDLAAMSGIKPSLVTGYSKPDIMVFYDFVIQTFKDTNGAAVYPLNYNGTTYLPVRAISRLMNEPIAWDNTAKLISIGDGEEEQDEDMPDEEEQDNEQNDDQDDEEENVAAILFKDIFEREEALYYEASAKVTNIKNATPEEKKTIAASASDNYLKAQALTQEVKDIDRKDFTESERIACDKLKVFAESNEYYILVLENIAYLAAADADYSMLADTFLYFAVEAQNAMRAARELIIVE
ncbi:MAG: copper amine oxidase N-terminal protein [Bacillota bacterium]|nr:copper amine oxidase N-terminal protein [Bacillota bacterium]